VAFAIAFAVKTPIFPLHTWLPTPTPKHRRPAPSSWPACYEDGHVRTSSVRAVPLPKAAHDLAPLLLTAGVIGITYGAIVRRMQKDLKRLVAYSSVAHLGFIVLGTFALTVRDYRVAYFQMINHGITTGGLFLLVGMIYERRHTREIAELRGLQKVAPVMAGVFTVVMLSSIGLPGLNGFVGEFLILLGTFITHRWWAVVGATGVIFAAVYLLWAISVSSTASPTRPTLRSRI